jgi:hypothetical protein
MSFLNLLSGYGKKSVDNKKQVASARQNQQASSNQNQERQSKPSELYSLVESVLKDIATPSTTTIAAPKNEEKKTLGLLFIIVDDFPNEPLWRLWLEQINTNSDYAISVWFHAKYPNRVNSSWVRQRLVRSFQLQPEWGSLTLTKVCILSISCRCGSD